MQRFSVVGLLTVAVLAVVCAPSLFADPILVQSNGIVTGIDGFTLNGIDFYDVSFHFDAYDLVFANSVPTFMGDATSAHAAVAGIAALLNGPGGSPIQPALYSIGQIVFLIPYVQGVTGQSGVFDPNMIRSAKGFIASAGWFDDGFQDFSNTTIQEWVSFTPSTQVWTSVPEASSVLLCIIGIGALVVVRRGN